MSKWTPGPWDTANDGRDVISASTGYIVCETSGNEANARLIAAAPEMVELLWDLRGVVLEMLARGRDSLTAREVAERARALLAKVNA